MHGPPAAASSPGVTDTCIYTLRRNIFSPVPGVPCSHCACPLLYQYLSADIQNKHGNDIPGPARIHNILFSSKRSSVNVTKNHFNNNGAK
jgi:hypothetical protein